jgi:glycosyltransferase involved in cell wall biosynthesis
VSDDETGAVVADPTDAEALARAARPYLDPGRRAEAGRLARQEAERHAWEHHLARVLAVYEELVASQRP